MARSTCGQRPAPGVRPAACHHSPQPVRQPAGPYQLDKPAPHACPPACAPLVCCARVCWCLLVTPAGDPCWPAGAGHRRAGARVWRGGARGGAGGGHQERERRGGWQWQGKERGRGGHERQGGGRSGGRAVECGTRVGVVQQVHGPGGGLRFVVGCALPGRGCGLSSCSTHALAPGRWRGGGRAGQGQLDHVASGWCLVGTCGQGAAVTMPRHLPLQQPVQSCITARCRIAIAATVWRERGAGRP